MNLTMSLLLVTRFRHEFIIQDTLLGGLLWMTTLKIHWYFFSRFNFSLVDSESEETVQVKNAKKKSEKLSLSYKPGKVSQKDPVTYVSETGKVSNAFPSSFLNGFCQRRDTIISEMSCVVKVYLLLRASTSCMLANTLSLSYSPILGG